MNDQKESSFIPAIHSFRGLSIIVIVLGHSLTLEFGTDHPVLTNLLKGGTAFFIFISGFLFYHLLNERFSYSVFIKKKFNSVILPYLLCSSPILIYHLITGHRIKAFSDATSIETLFISIAIGRHMLAYWFIPFITLIYLTVPLSIRFSKLNMQFQCLILILLFSFSLFIHRPANSINPIHSFVYYLPLYLLGIFIKKYWLNLVTWLKNIWYVTFLIFSVLLAVYQFMYVDTIGAYNKSIDQILTYEGVDLMLIQKICLILFFLGFFEVQRGSNKFLSLMANYSFPIFFIHGYVKWGLLRALNFDIVLNSIFKSSLLKSTVLFVLILLISTLITFTAKKLLGKRSKYILGS